MKSMTGFGKSEAVSENGAVFYVEVFSLNRKQLEIKAYLPKELLSLEPVIREKIASKISRGSVTARISLLLPENILQETIQVNDTIISGYLRKLRRMQEKHELFGAIDLVAMLMLPGAVSEIPASLHPENDINALKKALDEALEQLSDMRSAEGASLKKDVLERLLKLESIVSSVEGMASKAPERQKQLFLKRLADSGMEINPADERILKEITIFCDKYDTSEEITRLKSHFMQFRKFTDSADSSGRSLDFLIQEIFREINTLGNKTPIVDVTFLIVDFKTELEKIREQVQNIE